MRGLRRRYAELEMADLFIGASLTYIVACLVSRVIFHWNAALAVWGSAAFVCLLVVLLTPWRAVGDEIGRYLGLQIGLVIALFYAFVSAGCAGVSFVCRRVLSSEFLTTVVQGGWIVFTFIILIALTGICILEFFHDP